MSRRMASVEQASTAKKHGTGTDRGERLDLLPALSDPGQEPLIGDCLTRSPPAGHDEDVEQWAVSEGIVGEDAQATRCDDNVLLLSD